MNTNLIDRYIHEVGQLLPQKIREDVQLELRSLLTDSLEERAEVVGRAPDENLTVEVLHDFGAPKEVAASYAPIQKLLVEPALSPVMNAIILLNVFSIWAYVLYSLGSPALQGDATLLIRSAVLDAVISTVGSLLITGVVFIMITRVLASGTFMTHKWDPRTLPLIEHPDRANRFALIVESCVIFILIVLFNLLPEWIGAPYFLDGRWKFVSFLAPAFRAHLPWLNLLGILNLVLNGIVLRTTHWTPATRWAELGISGLAAVILYRLFIAGPLTNVTTLNEFLDGMFLVMLVFVGVELCIMFYRLLKRPDAHQPVLGASILLK